VQVGLRDTVCLALFLTMDQTSNLRDALGVLREKLRQQAQQPPLARLIQFLCVNAKFTGDLGGRCASGHEQDILKIVAISDLGKDGVTEDRTHLAGPFFGPSIRLGMFDPIGKSVSPCLKTWNIGRRGAL
jgi:hypothetical protein